MKNLLTAIALASFAAIACKTPSVTNTTHTQNEVKSDSIIKNDSSFSSEVIIKEITPASFNTIETFVLIDSTGLLPFELVTISNTDTLKVFGSGKKIQAKSNCAAREKHYIETIKGLTSQLLDKSKFSAKEKEVVFEKQVVTERVTPIGIWIFIGFLASIIVYLLLKNSIK